MQTEFNRFSKFDEYGLKYWPKHLVSTGERQVAEKLLLDWDWLSTKLSTLRDINALLADYQLIETDADKDRVALEQALRLSAHLLSRDPELLRGQLVGRLLANHPTVQEIAKRSNKCIWIRPLSYSYQNQEPLVRTFSTHQDLIWAIQALPDNQRIISASGDSTLKLWDIETGVELRTYRGHKQDVRDVAVSRDGKHAVSASRDGSLILWEIETGEKLKIIKTGENDIFHVVCLPDGKRIVSLSHRGMYQVWDMSSGKELNRMDSGHGGTVTGLAILPDGNSVLSTCHSSGDSAIKIWNLDPNTKPSNISTRFSNSCPTVLPDGKRFFTIEQRDKSDYFMLWDLKTHQLIFSKRVSFDYAIQSACYVPVLQKALLAVYNGVMILCSVDDQSNEVTVAENAGAVYSSCLLPTQNVIATGDREGLIKIWNLKATGSTSRLKFPHGAKDGQPIDRIAIFPDSERLVASTNSHVEGKLKLWHLKERSKPATVWDSETAIQELEHRKGKSVPVPFDEVFADDRYVSTPRGSRVTCIKTSIEGRKLLAGLTSGDVLYWDQESLLSSASVLNHGTWVSGVDISRNEKIAVSVGYDALLVVWNLRRRRALHILEGHKAWINDVAVSSDGRVAVSASNDKTVCVWNIRSGRMIHRLEGHADKVESVTLFDDDQKAISSTAHGEVKTWDLKNGTEESSISVPIATYSKIKVLADERYCVAIFRDHLFKVWSLGTGEIVASFGGDSNLTEFALGADRLTIAAGDASGNLFLVRVEGVTSSKEEPLAKRRFRLPFFR